MTDRPIIFSAPMVRALLAGRKTMTRRLATSPLAKTQSGDRLWARETWSYWPVVGEKDRTEGLIYRATDDDWECRMFDWRPSIRMPRWASRLTLIVEAVKVEPLLDISEDDARAEGFADGPLNDGFGSRDIGGGWIVSSPGGWASAAGHFQILWTKLHPEWDGYSSPDVVAISFRVALANIDAPAAVGDAGREAGE